MNKIVSIGLLGVFTLVLIFVAGPILVENQSLTQVTPTFDEKIISVTGIASASVEPDLLVITFGVQTQHKIAKDAFAVNSESINNVISAIRSLGISDDDLSTSELSIYPVYESYTDDDNTFRQKFIHYQVTNTITVHTSNLNSAADIIDSAVSAGANRVDNVYFTLTPQTKLQTQDQLLKEAVINAKTKAEITLSPLNHKIIGIKNISLSESDNNFPRYSDQFSLAKSSNTEIFSSDQNISVTANVVFIFAPN